jgi:hypothetical protein
MRALVSPGLLVPPLVCAALVLGPVGTAAASVDAGPPASGRTALSHLDDVDDAEWSDAEWDALWSDIDSGMESDLSWSDATFDTSWSEARLDALLAQLDALDELDDEGALTPLLDVMTSLVERGGSRLAPTEAARYAKDLEAANTKVQQRLRDLDSTALRHTRRSPAPTADPVTDVVGSLQTAVQDLTDALTTTLDLGEVLDAVTGLLDPMIGTVTGVLGGVLGVLPPLPAE